MGSESVYRSVVQDNDTVCILHGGNALRDNQLCGIRYFLRKCPADFCIRGGVHGAGTVVKNQDLRLFEQRAGDAQALFLPAGNIRPALFNVRVVSVRKAVDKFVCAGQTAGAAAFVVGGVRIAPAQIFIDSAGKEHIVLQHDGYPAAQRIQIIGPHVRSADGHGAGRDVVETADQIDERGL